MCKSRKNYHLSLSTSAAARPLRSSPPPQNRQDGLEAAGKSHPLKFLPRFLIATVLVALIAAASVTGYVAYSTRDIIKNAKKIIEDPAKLVFEDQEKTRNILILGIDYNYDRRAFRYTKGVRSDTILVLRVDRWGHSLSMLSVPRDLRVRLGPGLGMDKINAAFSLGGVEQAKRTVGDLLRIPIHHHILVKVDAAASLVDILGGVEVDVEKEMNYDDTWANFHVHLKPGLQRLNGEQAVGYCRFRNDEEGDLGRIRRQQQFLTALSRELKRPQHLKEIPKVAGLFATHFESDLSRSQLIALATLYKDFSTSRIKKGMIPVYDLWIGGISYLAPHLEQMDEMVDDMFKQLTDPTLAQLRTEVINATDSETATAEAILRLQKAGFNVVRARTDARLTVTQTRAVLRTPHANAEKQLSNYFKNIEVVEKEEGLEGLDLSVWVGMDLESEVNPTW